MLGQQRFVQAGDVEVHQRQVDVLQAFLAAQQPAINLDLRPVQVTPVVGHAVQVTAVGFDLFELVLRRVIPISPAAHPQVFVVALQAHF